MRTEENMMREILFRGKRFNNGEWVEGYLIHDEHCNTHIPYIGYLFGYDIDVAECILGTVGQFTGLTDKNGKKIFEGDIVEGHCHSQWRHELQRCEVAYDRDGFVARHHVKCGGEHRYYTYKVLFSKDVVVIGNIHDNPELLGGTKNG